MFVNEANRCQAKTATASIPSRRKSVSKYFEIISFYGLLATIFLFAIPYGTVTVWHKALLILAISIIAGCRVMDGVLRGTFRIAEPLMLLPLAGVLGLAIIQSFSFPGMASAISVDPYETKVFIVTFGGLLVAGEVLFFYTNSLHRLKCLIGLVLVVGVGSAIFGILRGIYLDGQPGILANYLPPDQGYAQFINRNHFAFLMEMAFGLLLGILIKGRLPTKLKFCGWAVAGILIYAVITANSRGGILSFTALILFAVAIHLITGDERLNSVDEATPRPPVMPGRLVRKISGAVGLFGLVFALIVITIAFVGGDTVVTRFEKLKDEVGPVKSTVVNRNFIWRSTLDLIRNEPVLGVGFGGYAVAITRFDPSGGKHSLHQAHNDYLEVLASGGIVGFALFGAFGAQVVSRIFRNMKSTDRFTKSRCFGAAIGIFAVLVHSFVDFGLHIMINALILAVLVVVATVNRVDEKWSSVSHMA